MTKTIWKMLVWSSHYARTGEFGSWSPPAPGMSRWAMYHTLLPLKRR